MKRIVTTLLMVSAISGCGGGGGGGGDEYLGAALVSLDVSPNEIDPGDRTELRINIAEVDENGIALKVRFPLSLGYVPSSTTIETPDQDDPVSLAPSVTVRADEFRYVVYFMKRSRFGESNQGTLRLQLEAISEAKDVAIEIDADVDDPKISNSREFDADSPEFGAEDSETIQIEN